MEERMSEDGWVGEEAVITDKLGLHARTAIKLTKLAMKFSCDIQIRSEQRPDWVNAKSPNLVIKLRPPQNSPLYIRASGDDAHDAVEALVGLVARNFRE